MKKVLFVIYIILVLILSKLIVSFCINENFISNYKSGKYDEGTVKSLLVLNIPQPCVAHYNYGNVLYKNGNYDIAIEQYNRALELFPSKEEECSIRINLALAMLKKIDEKDDSEDNKIVTLQILNNARNVLCENGCANKNDDKGHSAEAERLKKDIDKRIKELEEQTGQDSNDDGNDDGDDDDNKDNNKNVDKKEQQLKEIQAKSREERESDLSYVKNLFNYDFYRGKQW